MLVLINEETHVTKNEESTLCGLIVEKKHLDNFMGRGAWLGCRKCKELLNKNRRGKAPKIERLTILDAIMACFIQVWQARRRNRPDCKDRADSYLDKAEELVKLLESLDCRSWGGYDSPNDGIPSLFMRFEWLLYKYNVPLELERTENYEELRKFFTKEDSNDD